MQAIEEHFRMADRLEPFTDHRSARNAVTMIYGQVLPIVTNFSLRFCRNMSSLLTTPTSFCWSFMTGTKMMVLLKYKLFEEGCRCRIVF